MEGWDDSPAPAPAPEQNAGSWGDADASVDTGRNFSRGRGFTRDTGAGGNDDGWGATSNGDDGGGRGERKVKFDRNGNDWGERRGRGGGRGGRGGRGGGGGDFGFKSNDDWGSNDTGGGNDDWGISDDRGSRGGRGGRGRGRGGGRGRGDRDGNDEWGSKGNDDWGGSNDTGGNGEWGGRGSRGRGGGRGRGDRDGNDEWGGDKSDDKPEKPREIYVPPEPTDNVEEMFGTSISSGINFDKYDSIPVDVTGENVVPAIHNFEESGLREIVRHNIKKSGYTKPTPIQKAAIPIIMAGRDVMACAQTGSGKTAAFLVPIIHRLLEDKVELVRDESHCEPQVVIVSPTRELAIQIAAEARKFAYDSVIRVTIAYGGTSVGYQIDQLKRGCHILVATPGRLNDFVSKDRVTFGSVRFFVLDEADRMLDMGFMPAIEQMMEHSSMVAAGERQTLMFSATFPEEIQRLASKFLCNYLFITVGIVGGACSDVQQNFFQVTKFEKRTKLLEILKESAERTLVFIETKRNADFIALFLGENELRTTSIHGDRLQREREEALQDFKSGNRDVLVATDVAARGLDIKNVKHVINFDLPKNIDEYVHRIGRTGRVGNRGQATSFYDAGQDQPLAPSLVKILKGANQSVPDWLERAGAGGEGSFRGGRFGGRDVRDSYGQASNDAPQEPQEEW